MADLTITVVGAGTMGNGIAHVFALHGHSVYLVDVDPPALERATAAIEKNLDRQAKKGVIAKEMKGVVRERISSITDLDEAASESDFVLEAVTEDEAVKSRIFRRVDEVAPAATILASNTSSISITSLGAATKRADRVIGMHFFNPVPVMELVEIVRGLETSDETFSSVYGLAEELGKTPVEVRDFPGFVSNRILMPMINEAIFCVMEGVASVKDVDTVMKLGMNHPMGPLTLADFIGLDVCLSIMQVLHDGLGDDKYRPCPLLRKMVAAGQFGRKSGRGFYAYDG